LHLVSQGAFLQVGVHLIGDVELVKRSDRAKGGGDVRIPPVRDAASNNRAST
jgi:hypothetical protein